MFEEESTEKQTGQTDKQEDDQCPGGLTFEPRSRTDSVASITLDTSSDVLITLSLPEPSDSEEVEEDYVSPELVTPVSACPLPAPGDKLTNDNTEDSSALEDNMLSPGDSLLALKSLSDKQPGSSPIKNPKRLKLSRVRSDSYLCRTRTPAFHPVDSPLLHERSLLSPDDVTDNEVSMASTDESRDTSQDEDLTATPPLSPTGLRKSSSRDFSWPMSFEEPELLMRMRRRRRFYSDPNPSLLASPGFFNFLRFRKSYPMVQSVPATPPPVVSS